MTSGLKPLDEIDIADSRQKVLVRTIASTGETIPFRLADLHEAISEIVLTPVTPEHIADHFDIARNLLLYSWFVYDFSTPALGQAYVSVEFAIKERLNADGTPPKERWGLKRLLREAIDRGWLKDGGFPHLQHRADPTTTELVRRENFDPEGTAYCMMLLDALPNLRNSLAHGSTFLVGPDASLAPLKVCAAIINQLYPDETNASA